MICKEKVYVNFWNVITHTCYNKYGDESVWYTCERDSCPNSTHHLDDDDDSMEHQTIAPDPVTTLAPSMHACSVHETSVSGDHSWVTPACGDSTHAGYACQIGSTHTSLQASCTVTNSNSDYCTVTSFYDCQFHTHVYPSSDDDDSGGSAQMVVCQDCHLWYDSSDASLVTYHTQTKPCWHCCQQIPMCMTHPSKTCDVGGMHQRDP